MFARIRFAVAHRTMAVLWRLYVLRCASYRYRLVQTSAALDDILAAWHREGVPFHLWLTSPACEVIDITFAMNLGTSRTRDEPLHEHARAVRVYSAIL